MAFPELHHLAGASQNPPRRAAALEPFAQPHRTPDAQLIQRRKDHDLPLAG